jgi:hypothetical protein
VVIALSVLVLWASNRRDTLKDESARRYNQFVEQKDRVEKDALRRENEELKRSLERERRRREEFQQMITGNHIRN